MSPSAIPILCLTFGKFQPDHNQRVDVEWTVFKVEGGLAPNMVASEFVTLPGVPLWLTVPVVLLRLSLTEVSLGGVTFPRVELILFYPLAWPLNKKAKQSTVKVAVFLLELWIIACGKEGVRK